MVRAIKKAVPLYLLLGLCTCGGTAHFYPTNDIAGIDGVMTGVFTENGTGHGNIRVTSPSGEVFAGEYSLIGQRFGSISAFSAGHHSLNCQFENSAFGHGNGMCERSDGATYQLEY